MSEDHMKNIPTLEDVVEIGDADQTNETESIRIVADNDVIDDEFGDEFNKLFDTNAEEQAVELSDETDIDDSLTDDLWDESSISPELEISTTATTDTPTPEDTPVVVAEVEESASETPAPEEDELWIQQWQEDSPDVVMDDDVSVEIEMRDEPVVGEVTDDLVSDDVIKAAIIEDERVDHTQEAVAPASCEEPPSAPVQDVNPTGQAVDTAEIVNQVVSELMPEIEWKLRTRIREVLEEHFPPED